MQSVKDKRVLITGGASGIGLCTALEFSKAGSDLVITDINETGLKEAEKKLASSGATVHTRVVNVVDKEQVCELAKWVIQDLGGLDILINNAGIGYGGELADTTLETWNRLLTVNLLGPLYHIYAFLPHFKEKGSGHIVNVSSGQAFFRLPTWGAYASIKAALAIISETLYYELKKYNIKVTTVYPFMVNTPFYKDIPGETWAGKMAMKLVPYYSMLPEKVAKIILKAVKKQAKVEMVSVLNDVGFYAQFLPFAHDVMALTTNLLLVKGAKSTA